LKWSGTLTYSFPDSSSDYPAGYGYSEPRATGFAQVSAMQQQAVAGVAMTASRAAAATTCFTAMPAMTGWRGKPEPTDATAVTVTILSL
jgi:hypothetical protein